MPESKQEITWETKIKALADDFCLSQIKVNKVLKQIKNTYEQREREIPSFYNGSQDEFLYDKAQKEIMNLLYA